MLPSGEVIALDLALSFDDPVARTGLTLCDVGDLAKLAALDTLDATGRYVHVAAPSAFDPAAWWLLRGERVMITVREGPDATAPLHRQLPERQQPPSPNPDKIRNFNYFFILAGTFWCAQAALNGPMQHSLVAFAHGHRDPDHYHTT